MYLIFDTETTGLPRRWDAPVTDTDNWPRAVQIAWQLHDDLGRLLEHKDYLITPDGFNIPFDAEKIHGISTALAQSEGVSIQQVLREFSEVLSKARFIVGQNVGFDVNIMGAEFHRGNFPNPLTDTPILDTCTETTATLCRIPGGRGGKFKLPTLTELHEFLFGERFEEAHNATADVEATARCFFELIRREEGFTLSELRQEPDYFLRFTQVNRQAIQLYGLQHKNLKAASEQLRKALEKQTQDQGISREEIQDNLVALQDVPFAHLHNHTQFSILQSTAGIKDLVQAAVKNHMPAVALTDIGNMMGAFHFVREVGIYNKGLKERIEEAVGRGEEIAEAPLIPIVGCTLNVCENHLDKSVKDHGYQIVFLAKNKNGYHNLAKMSSIAFTQGFYYVPRIDRKIVEAYKEDLIVLTGNLNGEVPSKILNIGENQAEEALLWWKDVFGEDLYIELMRHGLEEEDRVNEVLLQFASRHSVKYVAANSTYYIDQKEAETHDILLCVKAGEKKDTPIGNGRGFRYGLANQEYYFKSADQMKDLFKDLPEAITNIREILDKIEPFELARDVLLPKFTIPSDFQVPEDDLDGGKRGENKYLRHLTYEGAKKRYPEMNQEIRDRLDFELKVIENTGYPGYFLIVQDFIAAAREMGVSVGPGRGSAAGSAVAYCLGITNMDPIAYDLLFERFLNPDRVSLPDIDIDFDDEGRSKVMNYVIEKYGANQVAQIITYGTMAAKSSIRDTARVLDLPLNEADRIAKLIPNMKLSKIFQLDEQGLKSTLRSDEVLRVNELKNLAEGEGLEAVTIRQAQMLEGSLRNTGIHACGVIITPDDITKFVPVATAKDSELYVTQFDNSVVESAGLLKMDFLGLKTLTLIKDTVKLVEYRHGIKLDPDSFPLDDEKTYALFQKGETVGIFQYESPGMQKYMKDLKPTVFADLIAMNALYRPGPLEYIPSFIRRKHGDEPIEYDLPAMEEYLKETYGITVYQEQVMLLSQKLAGFTKGEADVLRKAMGKKMKDVLDKMKPSFIERGEANGHDPAKLEKIWRDWEAFASYAFNKSHSTCYAWIGYQTAYLKANYPAEYMAAVLSNNMNDIKQVTFFLEECRRMGLKVLGPDVNESFYKFTVNKENAIRFGMGAIKGVGRAAVDAIVEGRKEGKYRSVFDLAKRIDHTMVNKRVFENLVLAGGFDSFPETHRAQYFQKEGEGIIFLEKIIKYGIAHQQNANAAQISLFGEASEVQIPEPVVPSCEEWSTMEKLRREREVVGIYISGHPLDDFAHEIKHFCNANLGLLKNLHEIVNREVSVAGIVTDVQHRVSKNGKGWAIFTVEDYEESVELRIFDEEYLKYRHFLVINSFVHLKIFVREGYVKRETGVKQEPRLQFNNIQMLQGIMDTYAKKLTLHLTLESLTKSRIQTLQQIASECEGDSILNIVVHEPKEKMKVVMPSKKVKVKISAKLLNALVHEDVPYKLN